MDNTLDALKADPKNPRYINKEDFAKLKELLKEYGDLSGIVKNQTTGELVGGHMRINAFKEMGGTQSVQVTQTFDTPTRTGTVAIGYVLIDGEMFTYREVQWPREKQTAANIAANRAGGDFDKDLLAQVVYELSQLENGAELLAMTALLEDEVKTLLGQVSGEGLEDDKYTKEIVAPTYEPTGDKPNVEDIVNLQKTNALLAEIEATTITEQDKQLLRLAAYRHNIFNYELVAEYYAHSSAEVQNLMEKSALVIIDYGKAIENGYTQMTDDLSAVQSEDNEE